MEKNNTGIKSFSALTVEGLKQVRKQLIEKEKKIMAIWLFPERMAK
jgi:hypothetical protein